MRSNGMSSGGHSIARAAAPGAQRACVADAAPVHAQRPATAWRIARGAAAAGAGLCLMLAAAGCRSSASAGVSMEGESASEVETNGGGMDLETARGVVDLIGKSATIMTGVTQQWLDYSNTKAAMGMAERESKRQQRYETLRTLISSRSR